MASSSQRDDGRVRTGGGGSLKELAGCDRPNEVDGAQAKKDEGLMAKLVVGFLSVLGEQRAPAAIYGDGDHCFFAERELHYARRQNGGRVSIRGRLVSLQW